MMLTKLISLFRTDALRSKVKEIVQSTAFQTIEYLSKCSKRCMLCGSDIFEDGLGICRACINKFRFNNGKTCIRCGAPIKGEESFCGHCNAEKIYYQHAYSAFEYADGIRNVIHSIKYGNNAVKCYQLAYYLCYLATKFDIQYDAVCCVPMTATAVKHRGYNQSELLARFFCQLNNTHCFCDALVKVKETHQQEKLSRRQRMTNVVGAYSVQNAHEVEGKRILLVDDVKTTGATLNNCSKALIKAGAIEVNCITVAAGEYKISLEVDSYD